MILLCSFFLPFICVGSVALKKNILFLVSLGANAKLRYQLTAGNTMGTFDVEPEVGTLYIAQKLDYERVQRYELRLVASDGKWENQTTVVVNVINQNDEVPVFDHTEYYASVTEELTDLPILALQVRRETRKDQKSVEKC